MPLQSSGQISLNDIHIEAGGTTGTEASINDTDIRDLIDKSSATQMSFSEWYGASNVASATGGTISTYNTGGKDYQIHTFLSSGTFTITNYGQNLWEYMCVGGGGSGGYDAGGGGGAGGMRVGTFSTSGALPKQLTITVGAGGSSGSGSNSSISSLIGYGGGYGGSWPSTVGANGGSGGGGLGSSGGAAGTGV